MIDINEHILYDIGDCSAIDREEAEEMLQIAVEQGITDIILTPSLCREVFLYPLELIERQYFLLKEVAEGMGLRLHLGSECYVDYQSDSEEMAEAFQCGRCHTLANGPYVFVTFPKDLSYNRMLQVTKGLVEGGLKPILGFFEMYSDLYGVPSRVEELIACGAWISVNAASVLGYTGDVMRDGCRKLLENNMVDVICSGSRGAKVYVNYMKECYDYIQKEYGTECAERLMEDNPRKILEHIVDV